VWFLSFVKTCTFKVHKSSPAGAEGKKKKKVWKNTGWRATTNA